NGTAVPAATEPKSICIGDGFSRTSGVWPTRQAATALTIEHASSTAEIIPIWHRRHRAVEVTPTTDGNADLWAFKVTGSPGDSRPRTQRSWGISACERKSIPQAAQVRPHSS